MSRPILTPEQRIRQRYAWFEEATRLGNVTLACRRLGISRKTFYTWRKRYGEVRRGPPFPRSGKGSPLLAVLDHIPVRKFPGTGWRASDQEIVGRRRSRVPVAGEEKPQE